MTLLVVTLGKKTPPKYGSHFFTFYVLFGGSGTPSGRLVLKAMATDFLTATAAMQALLVLWQEKKTPFCGRRVNEQDNS